MMAICGLPVGAALAAPPPLTAFSRLPAIETAEISPDGTRVALLGGPAGERVVFIASIDGTNAQTMTVRFGASWVRGIRWAGNEFLIVSYSTFDGEETRPQGNAPLYERNRNVVINRRGKIVANLLSNSAVSKQALSQPVIGVLQGRRPAEISAIVVGLDLTPGVWRQGQHYYSYESGVPIASAALWRFDFDDGATSVIERGNTDTRGWDVDAAGGARVRWDYDGGEDELTYFTRPKGQTGWTRLRVRDMGEAEGLLQYLGYSDPEDAVYLAIRLDRQAKLIRRDLGTGAVTRVALTAPVRDLELQWDRDRNAPVAVVNGMDRPAYQWLDADLGKVHARLTRTFPSQDVRLVSWSRSRNRIVARVSGPSHPPVWYLFDVVTGQASPLGESYPELAGAALGVTTWTTYKSRDGLEIPAYLTLPPGAVADARLPLIVLAHGGPAVRDEFTFDWWVQAIATRGYAVLQPQFRGSSGFGEAHETAGHRQWGGKMQEDLVDGVAALAARGTIDPKRVCIAGASYGGYAALMGATSYPDTYRCAISVNGVSDLSLMFRSQVRAYGRDTALVNSLARMMGDPERDPRAFRMASPALLVTDRTSPILLIHSENDSTVPFQQSRTMRDALVQAGKPVDLVTLRADDHYLSTGGSRQQMLEWTFAYLNRWLPATS